VTTEARKKESRGRKVVEKIGEYFDLERKRRIKCIDEGVLGLFSFDNNYRSCWGVMERIRVHSFVSDFQLRKKCAVQPQEHPHYFKFLVSERHVRLRGCDFCVYDVGSSGVWRSVERMFFIIFEEKTGQKTKSISNQIVTSKFYIVNVFVISLRFGIKTSEIRMSIGDPYMV
jgi:hypothetical protein